MSSREAFEEEANERMLAMEIGEYDCGQSDDDCGQSDDEEECLKWKSENTIVDGVL